MNKKGSVFLSIVFAGMFFVMGMVFLNYVKLDVTETTSSTGLDCSNVNALSDGTKLTCLLTDSVVPVLIISVLSVTGGILLGRTE